MTKLLKNKKGFTLVEVIVVAVIVLILAAVAIPLYNGYIRDSRIASLENAAGSIASGVGAAVQTNNAVEITTAATDTSAGLITIGTGANTSQIIIPKGMLVTFDTPAAGDVTLSYINTAIAATAPAVTVRASTGAIE
ncbi:MAG: prepilin-type N-terminal cleavage/methylation domain-containing protein [Chitinispirillales bacterium]|jgi:prepilin-type N-terminal cleavage/methylation domain-containing protein|nr:prepilin-type N-terminal cleavage/methylation domain-containing protein [Chitinispirillales bacterium]